MSGVTSGCPPAPPCIFHVLSTSPLNLQPRLFLCFLSQSFLAPPSFPFLSKPLTKQSQAFLSTAELPSRCALSHDKSLSSTSRLFVRPPRLATPRLKLLSETRVDFSRGPPEGQPFTGNLRGRGWWQAVTITRAGTPCFTYLMALPSISPQN